VAVHRQLEGAAHGPGRGPGHDPRRHDEPAVVIEGPRHDLGLTPVARFSYKGVLIVDTAAPGDRHTPRTRNRRVLVGIAALAVAIVAIILVLALRDGGETGPSACETEPNVLGDTSVVDGFGNCDGASAVFWNCLSGRILWLDEDNDQWGYEGDDWQPMPADGVLPDEPLNDCTR
jgi:hypothetical protein